VRGDGVEVILEEAHLDINVDVYQPDYHWQVQLMLPPENMVGADGARGAQTERAVAEPQSVADVVNLKLAFVATTG
jgi:hypothetical protein